MTLPVSSRTSLMLCAFFTLPVTFAHAGMPIPKPPTIAARSYVLIDFQSRKVLAEEKADERMEPASLTKLMTAYGVFRALKEKRLRLVDPVSISAKAASQEGSRTHLQPGSQVPVEALIKGMIVQSGNDAAMALAERVGGSEEGFVELMNAYARQLHMNTTHFANSNGLPNANHYSTARDLAVLAMAVIREFPEYYKYYGLKEFTWNNIRQLNRNGLLSRDSSVDGIKTGHTETAGYCLIASANRDGMRLVSVVLGSQSFKGREDASSTLLNYGYTYYETVKIKSRGDTVLKPHVWMSNEEFAAVGPLQDIVLTVGRGEVALLKTSAKINEPLMAPLSASQPVGELTVRSADGDVVSRVPLYPLKDIGQGSLTRRLVDTVMLWFE